MYSFIRPDVRPSVAGSSILPFVCPYVHPSVCRSSVCCWFFHPSFHQFFRPSVLLLVRLTFHSSVPSAALFILNFVQHAVHLSVCYSPIRCWFVQTSVRPTFRSSNLPFVKPSVRPTFRSFKPSVRKILSSDHPSLPESFRSVHPSVYWFVLTSSICPSIFLRPSVVLLTFILLLTRPSFRLIRPQSSFLSVR